MEKFQRHFSRRLAAVVAATALSAGLASGAFAQNANAVTGGTTNDNTSAGNVNGGGLPQIQQQGAVSFTSGGVGLDESHALRAAEHDWPLSLRFTGPSSEYLADVHVKISDAHGGDVLDTTSRGPYMLVKLPPGRYTVQASYKDHAQTRTVTVPANGTTKAAFSWQT
ncbi:carboxypeptidase-like regulatory domain-containing protein [Paraburkholderia rhizosphaerae]|uniref:Carboxypeptidase family protein n=1 Tax=Paraburkholderia rhizosphaerae TaxID=480658 RepID=A0A4V3HFI4_9BURK|nr:carboxypeptidase-like regulatory domain-containing protein [Paraburkholderia rhizosphaerae]TDY53275.1 carboxypeptidase family protein [Paraburkholderia rhizosphaerae]